MRALITGAAGFVGRHMLAELQARGWDTTGVDINPMPIYVATNGDLPGRYQQLSALVGDARDIFSGQRLCWRELSNQRFDLVVHCAYHVGGRAAIDGNPSLLALNLELDAQLFNWAVRTGQERVLYYSSSAVYPIEYQGLASAQMFRGLLDCHASHQKWVPLTENMIDLGYVKQPDARYGWAKLTGEHLAAAASLAGLRVHVVRPFSGYGGDQDCAYPFPAILRRVVTGDLSVWGPRGQRRDWVHIDDIVGCSLAVVEQDVTEPVNICSGVGVEMGDLAIHMADIAGVPINWPNPANMDPRTLVETGTLRYLEDQPTGVMVRVGDPTRMLNIYQPRVDLDEGIRRALGELR